MIDCAFCDEFAQPFDDTWLVARTDQRVVLPTIGCLREGYLLYMPADHTLAFADLDRDILSSCSEDLDSLRAQLHERYGPMIIAEHGPRECDLGAGCCDHAHMHLIPIPDPAQVLDQYVARGGPQPRFDNLADCLASIQEAYVYVSPEPGAHYVWPAQGFPRQWVRRVCAEIHGKTAEWDWRDHSFTPERRRTYEALKGNLTLPSALVSQP
ncbi:hypothetical protein DMB66_23205 [Actinoplanes sp. ATCC 53533]|uniref:hypothetical protein n=1 Tax=Actinoplanes sp. ATCC 53533 TaxID=1288362 RepID=UPI000F7B4C73|nr:hypothetical protein [Actinoplanes sp. ATCC 53533]RSM61974.1 hypothetical protein DMB66_23205 [Actinoplanes sp. ATCC 53533]